MRDWVAPQRKSRSMHRVEGKAGWQWFRVGAGPGLGTERYLT